MTKIETVDHCGIRLRLDETFMSQRMLNFVREGQYEVEESRQINRILQQDDVVLEIGAGIGFISALMLKNPLVKRLVAYEANPILIDRIRDTVCDNGLSDPARFELVNAVLGHDEGDERIDFYIHEDFWASSLIRSAKTRDVRKVKRANFNAVLASLRPTIIVCDIEGGELSLFGAAQLQGVRGVYIELHQKMIGRRGIREVFGFFHERGFHYDATHSQGSVVYFSSVDLP